MITDEDYKKDEVWAFNPPTFLKEQQATTTTQYTTQITHEDTVIFAASALCEERGQVHVIFRQHAF